MTETRRKRVVDTNSIWQVPIARRVPSPDHAIERIALAWPSSTCKGLAAARTSQILAVSREAVARRVPSVGENEADRTQLSCSSMDVSSPSFTFHTTPLLSAPVAMRLLSADQESVLTWPICVCPRLSFT